MHLIRSALLALLLLMPWSAGCAGTAPGAAHGAMPSSARDLALAAIGDRRLVLVGEMHGTQETPALLGDMLDAYAARRRPAVLALEISTREQARIDRYLASRGTDADRRVLLAGAHWRDPMHDGRDSAAMFGLIEHTRRLHVGGADVVVFAFDAGGEDRNRGMADALRSVVARRPAATVLVLTGNVHAMTRRPQWEMFDGGKRIEPPITAGRYLADLAPLSIDVEGASGAYWACTAGACRVQAIGGMATQRGPTLMRNAPDNAWDVTLVLPHFTPSPPAIRAMAAAAAPARAANP